MELRKQETAPNTLTIEFFGDLDAKGCRQAQHQIDEVIHSEALLRNSMELNQEVAI